MKQNNHINSHITNAYGRKKHVHVCHYIKHVNAHTLKKYCLKVLKRIHTTVTIKE